NARPQTGDRPNVPMSPEVRARLDLNYQKWKMLYDEGAALVLEPGAGDGGVVYVTRVSMPTPFDTAPDQRPVPWEVSKPKIIPEVVVAAEQYNRIVRLLNRGIPVSLEFNIEARFHDDDPLSH